MDACFFSKPLSQLECRDNKKSCHLLEKKGTHPMRMHNNTTCKRSNQNAGFLDTTNTTCNRSNQNARLTDTHSHSTNQHPATPDTTKTMCYQSAAQCRKAFLVVNKDIIQVCIPVGCVPPTCCPYLQACTAGVSALGMSSLEQTPCMFRGCLLLGRVSASRGVSAPRGALLPGGCLLPGEVSALVGVCSWGVCIPACNAADTLPCGQTDTCENITFANFVCGQ